MIDIKAVIASKNPKLARLIPNFVYNHIKRLIHQDELNEILTISEGKNGIDFVDTVISYLDIQYEQFGFENININQRYIFASNHPLGGLDALIMMKCISDKFNEIKFVANDLLMVISPLQSILVPVNKFGKQSIEYVHRIRETYASDAQILYFPAGICSRKGKEGIRDLDWKSSFIKNAISSKRDIVPVFFQVVNSNKFYRIANWRKKLGIKSNIEMILLPDEMFKKRGEHIIIRFGDPISYKSFDKSKSLKQWTEFVRERVYSLSESQVHKQISNS